MDTAEFVKKLKFLGACDDAREWVATQPDAATAWASCPRADWLVLLLLKMSSMGAISPRVAALGAGSASSDSGAWRRFVIEQARRRATEPKAPDLGTAPDRQSMGSGGSPSSDQCETLMRLGWGVVAADQAKAESARDLFIYTAVLCFLACNYAFRGHYYLATFSIVFAALVAALGARFRSLPRRGADRVREAVSWGEVESALGRVGSSLP
jgi:hypothetical protein